MIPIISYSQTLSSNLDFSQEELQDGSTVNNDTPKDRSNIKEDTTNMSNSTVSTQELNGGSKVETSEDEMVVTTTSGPGEIGSAIGTGGGAGGMEGGVETSIDPETSDASQTIGSTGPGSGSDTRTGELEDNVAKTFKDASTSIKELTNLEQTFEDKTDGAAFLDPTKKDDISDRETWSIPTDNSAMGTAKNAMGSIKGMLENSKIILAVVASVLAGIILAYFGGN